VQPAFFNIEVRNAQNPHVGDEKIYGISKKDIV
jgi:hypothetical protein